MQTFHQIQNSPDFHFQELCYCSIPKLPKRWKISRSRRSNVDQWKYFTEVQGRLVLLFNKAYSLMRCAEGKKSRKYRSGFCFPLHQCKSGVIDFTAVTLAIRELGPSWHSPPRGAGKRGSAPAAWHPALPMPHRRGLAWLGMEPYIFGQL